MKSNTQLLGGWKVVPLANVAEIVMGQSPPGSTVSEWDGDSRVDTGLPFIQGNAEFGDMFPQPAKWCGRPVKIAEQGDTLISVRAPVGEVNRAGERTAIGRGLAAIRFTSADSHFGWHIVNHAKHEFARVTQGSTFQAVGGNELRALSVFLPPLAEQRAIAAVLDSIDEVIERTDAAIAATERLRDALLHELLTRGVPGWHSEWKEVPGIGTVPACWDVVRLGDVATLQRGMDLPSYKRLPGDVPVYGANGIHGFHSSAPLDGPGVITGRSGSMGLVHYSKSSYWPLNTTLYVKDFRGNNERYVYYFLSGLGLERFAASTGVPSLNRNFVHPILVSIPALAEQLTIVAVMDGVEEAAVHAREESDALQSFKVAVSDALLTGRVLTAVHIDV